MSKFVTRTTETIWSHKLVGYDWRGIEPCCQPESQHDDLMDALWPRSRLMAGGLSAPVWFEYPSHESEGARSCYVIEGFTQDADGNPLDGCKVRAFTTADKEFQEECNSNSLGFYRLGVYVQGPYFLLAHRSGAPDLGGASNDDVLPS